MVKQYKFKRLLLADRRIRRSGDSIGRICVQSSPAAWLVDDRGVATQRSIQSHLTTPHTPQPRQRLLMARHSIMWSSRGFVAGTATQARSKDASLPSTARNLTPALPVLRATPGPRHGIPPLAQRRRDGSEKRTQPLIPHAVQFRPTQSWIVHRPTPTSSTSCPPGNGAKLQVMSKLGSRRQDPKLLEMVQGHVDQCGAEGD